MLDGLSKMLGYLDFIFSWIVDMIEGIVMFFRVLRQSVQIPPRLLPFVPNFLGVSMVFLVAVTVIKIIFGRRE